MIGLGEGRTAFSLHLGEVTRVWREHPTLGVGWFAEVRVTTGAPFICRVVGKDLPLDPTDPSANGRKSYALVGFVAGNTQDAVCWPMRADSASDAELRTHDQIDEGLHFTVHVENFRGPATPDAPNGSNEGAFAVWTLRHPGNAPPDEDNGPARRYIQVVGAKGPTDTGRVQLIGGVRRAARAGSTGDGGPGDAVAITAQSSPNFAAWLIAMQALYAAAAPGLGLPAPGAPGGPPLPGGDGGPPADPVPEVDGEAAGELPATVQIVGNIVTGSRTVTIA